MSILFDEALKNAVAELRQWVADEKIRPEEDPEKRVAVIVLDVNGRMGVLFFSNTAFADDQAILELRQALRDRMGFHALPGDAIALLPKEHPAPDAIFNDTVMVRYDLSDSQFWRLDRLQTNQDWLRAPTRTASQIPLAVGFSIKGGVGRSTAFAMLALALARKGQRVIVVDLDLEAPGIGSLLLGETLPAYGLVDWLAETLVDEQGAPPLSIC
ncbi:MAG: P-loop NTPase [Alphaproteobacteria bacterium]|nr:P-loop NTPase [Alphaproteobacteria bacterium]